MADTINIIVNGTDNASGVLNRVSDSLHSFGTRAMGAGVAMTAMTAPLTIMGVKAINAAGDFEAAMNVLSVAAKSSATSMEDLSSAALAVGADTELVGISASQAGEAMTEMYKAGLTTNEIFGDLQGYLEGTASLSGVLRAAITLAAASELDLAQATQTVNTAMNTFGLSAEDASMIANVLVQTADAGVASVSGLADSLVTVGPVAAAMGIGIEDLNLALSLMADRGIEGAEAGTQLKSMLLNMQRDTSDVTGLWQALGVSMYDATGTMKALPTIMAELETSMAGMTQQQRNATISTLAGTYGMGAMNILLGEGAAGWQAMEEAIKNAATAEEAAEAQTEGFNAAMEALQGVLQSIKITVLGPFIKDTLTPMIQKIGEVLGKVMELDPKILNLGVVFAALAIAAGPALIALGAAATALGALLSPIGLVVLGVAALGVAWATNFGGIRDATQPIVDAVIGFIGRIPAAFDALVAGAQALWQDWRRTFTMVQTMVAGVFERIKSIITTALGIIIGSVQQNAGALQALFLNAYTKVQDIVQQALSAVQGIVMGVLGAIRSFLAEHGTDIQQTLADAWLRIATIVNMALDLINATVIPILQGIAQFIREHGAEIQAILWAAWTAIKTAIDVALTLIEGVIKAVLQIIKGDWSGAWETLKTTAVEMWEKIKDGIRIIAETIGPILVTIWEGIKEKAAEMWEGVKTVIKDKVEEIRQSIEDWAKALPGKIELWWADLKGMVATIWENVKTAIADKIADILTGVLKWLDDTLYAIENFDLKAAAEHFFGTVIPGIAAKVSEALEKVGNWLQDTWDKISNFDLKAAALALFVTVIAGIAAKNTEALKAVGDWLMDTWKKISNFDLKAAALALFVTVVAGIIEKAVNILAEVETFLNDIFSKITDYDFKSATLTSLQTIIAGIIEKAIDILQNVQTFLDDIRTKITEFSLHDAGVNLIQGFIDGISSMVGGAIAAAVAVVQGAITAAWNAVNPGSPSREGFAIGNNLAEGIAAGILAGRSSTQATAGLLLTDIITMLDDAIAAAKNLLGIKSPSTVFFAIGVDILRGLIAGIQAMTPEAVQALSAALSAAMQGVIDVLEAVEKLGAMTPLMDLPERMRQLNQMIREMVAELAILAGFYAQPGTGLDGAKAVLDALSPVFDGVQAAVRTFEAIGGLQAFQTLGDGLEAFIAFLRGSLPRMVNALADAASTVDMAGLPAATALAEAAGAIGSHIEDAIRGIQAAVSFSGTSSNIVDGVDRLAVAMRFFVAKLQYTASIMDYQAFDAALRLATAAGEIGSQIQAAINGILAAVGFRGTYASSEIEDGTDRLFVTMRFFVAKLQYTASIMDYQAFDAALRLATAAGTIGGQIQAAIDGILAAVGFRGTYASSEIEDGTDRLFVTMRFFVAKLQYTASIMDYQAFDAALRLATAAGTIGGQIQAAIDGILAAVGFRMEPIADGTDLFISQLDIFVNKLVEAGRLFAEDGLQAAVALATAAGTIGGQVRAAIDGILAVVGFRMKIIADGTDLFISQLDIFVNKLVEAGRLFAEDGLQAAVALAQAAGTIGSQIQAAINGILAVVGFRMKTIADGTDLFISQLGIFVNKLVEAGRLFDEEGLQGAVAFAQAAGTIGSQVDNAIKGLVAVAKYAGLEMETGAKLFVRDTATMVEKLKAAAADFDIEGLGAATAFAQAAGSIGSQIENAIAGLRAIMDYAGGLAATAVTRLANDLLIMVAALEEASHAFDGDALAAAQSLAEAAGKIGSSIESTVRGLEAIMAYAGGLTVAAIDRFLADTQLMVSRLAYIATLFSEDALAAAVRLATAAGAVGSGIQSMADAMAAIVDYAAPAPERIDEFAADIYTMIEKLRIVAAVLGDDAIDQAERFAQAGAAIYQAIEDGIDSVLGISTSGTMGGVGDAMREMVAQVVAGMAAMADAFDDMVTGAFNFGRDWVQAILDGLNSRLGDLEALMAYIRGLFPSSPAQYGPWRTLPDGAGVGRNFALAMAGGVSDGQTAVASALYDLRRSFDGGVSSGRLGGGLTVNQTFNVGNGDPATIRDAARLGLMEAARSLGVA